MFHLPDQSHDQYLNMADQDLDDFAFDEQGIYREVSGSLPNGDQGINLDEDGIWRDETDHWSHHTYRTYDSGIAINDHRSSSSTINRLPQVAADVDAIGYGHDSNTTDSLLPDEKSLNISELEASESMLGDEISFEQQSFHSDENLDLPELVDESYLVDSESSRDLHADYSRDSVTDRSEASASRGSYHDGCDYDEESSDLHGARQLPEYTRPDLSLDLGLLSHGSDWKRSANEGDTLEHLDNVPPMAQRRAYEVNVDAESRFTQEEPNSVFGGQSLIEFEELEAEVQTHLTEAPMDNLDLIGAYLHGLTQQEADDDAGSNGDKDEDGENAGDDVHHQADNDDGLRTDSGPDEQSESGRHSLRHQSKIPMLRSRSPLMSRPGSCSPHARARSTSPAVTKKHLSQLGISPRRSDRSASSLTLVNRKMPSPTSTSHSGDQSRSLPQTPQRDHSQHEAGSLQASQERSSRPAGDVAALNGSLEHDNERMGPGAEQTEEEGSIEDLPELSSHDSQFWRSNADFLPKLSRHSVLQKLKMTSQPQLAGASRAHPVKATGEATEAHSSCDETYDSEDLSQSSVVTADLKKRFLQEKHDRKEKELTLEQLQKEYNDLLKKHATAENLIDELRLGAKVTLHSNAPNAGQAQMGTVPPAQHGQVFNIPHSGTATVGTMGTQENARPDQQQGVRSDSHGSSASLAQNTQQHVTATSNNSVAALTTTIEPVAITQEESSSIVEEGTKLSLFAQAKSVEEQVKAFQILLNENAVSLDEQDQGLHNVKESMEKLQQAYRDAKSEHEYRRRQGKTGRDSVFDPDKEVEGELYKLSMKIDELEHTVQENLKRKFTRIPFQNPVKGDHNILMKSAVAPGGANFWEQADCEALSPRRPPSVGSTVGVSGDIDKTLHQLHKDYNALMDRYRKLKQLKKTPETDQEINSLLTKLKAIFEETPDHRKPALPPELESLYNPVRGTFMTPDQLREEQKYKEMRREPTPSRHRQRNRQRVMDTSSTAVESSDISSPERGHPHHHQTRGTPDKDSLSSSTRGEHSRRRRAGGRQLPDASNSSFRDSDWSTDQRYHGDYSSSSDPRHLGNQRQPVNTKSATSGRTLPNKVSRRSSHRDDKDSGYMGSEGGTKRNKDSAAAGLSRERTTRRGPIKTSALRSPNPLDSDTDTASTASTVEERSTKSTHRSSNERKTNSRGSKSSGHHHGGRDSSDANNRGRHSESEEVSMISGNRALNRSDVPGQNVISDAGVSQGSAFQVKQTRPPLIQPRPLQPSQVAPVTLTAAGMTAAGMTAVSAPQYHYQYPSGNMVQTPGMVPVSGMTTVHGPVQMHYGPVVTQPQPLPHFSTVPQPQLTVSSYSGVQTARPADHVISDDRYGRGRSHSFGGGTSSGLGSRGLQRGRYRSTQALSGHHDDDYDVRDGRDHYDDRRSRYTDRVWESCVLRDSPYDYRKRFEQIREERYGRDADYRDPSRRHKDYERSEEYYGRKMRHTRHRKDGQSQRHYDDDYADYDDVQGYYSDPEYPGQYTRSRRYYRHSKARTPDCYTSEYYDVADDYANEYDTGPLDEKYLTSSGVGASGIYANPGTQYSGSGLQAPGFGGAPFGGVDMASRGIQNVPHMTTTGAQYTSELMSNPGTNTDYTGAAANMMTGMAVPPGMNASAGQPVAAVPSGYGCQMQGMMPAGQVIPGMTSNEPTVVMAAPGHMTNGLQTPSGAASYIPVQVVQNVPPSASGAVPAVLLNEAAAVGGARPAVIRVLNNGTAGGAKVRYYVREYGAESDVEVTNRRRKKTSLRRGYQSYDEDYEEDDEKKESLRAALKTAKQLHRMSNKMKETLNHELSLMFHKTLAT